VALRIVEDHVSGAAHLAGHHLVGLGHEEAPLSRFAVIARRPKADEAISPGGMGLLRRERRAMTQEVYPDQHQIALALRKAAICFAL
jgi:hypothetical protein